ncbi:hypothetical protein ABIF69_000001, partial [Bradyrhizobium japonicum]
LVVNGSIVDTYTVTVGSGAFAFILSSVPVNFTGTGGTLTIPVVARFTAGVNTAMTAGSTISAMAAKR